MSENEAAQQAANMVEGLKKAIAEVRAKDDVLALVMSCGHALAQISERELEAGHYNHGLHLLAPLAICARLKEVITGKDGSAEYEGYITGAETLLTEIVRRENEPPPPLDLPDDMPQFLRDLLSGNMDNMEVRVHEIRRKKPDTPDTTVLN